MAGHVRLQSLTKLTASGTQRVDSAVDLGDFGQVTVQMRVAVPASPGSALHLQHAAVLEDEAFADCATMALDTAGSQVILLPTPLRYLRWRASITDLSATFLVDLIGREGASAPRWRPFQVMKVQQSVTNGTGDQILTWDETTSAAIVGDGLSWDDAGNAIAVGRTGLLTVHYNVSAWNSATWPALVNANTWLEEHDGTDWIEVPGSRSYAWAVAGTHSMTLHRVVAAANRKYRVMAVTMTGGALWRFDVGTFWARWSE